ncbi:CAP and S-layer homology domain-containing protein [Leucobacter sp. HY1910]
MQHLSLLKHVRWRRGAVILTVATLCAGVVPGQTVAAHAYMSDELPAVEEMPDAMSQIAVAPPVELSAEDTDVLAPEHISEEAVGVDPNASALSAESSRVAVDHGQLTAGQLALAPTRTDIVKRVNAIRAEHGLGALKSDPRLDAVAQTWSKQQAKSQTMSHNPHVRTQIPAGYRGLGENVAYGYRTTEAVVKGWRGSPPHMNTITRPYFTHVGTGLAYSVNGVPYYTQVFGAYPDGLSAPGVFADVSPGDKFYREIAWMKSSGLSTGTSTPAGPVYQPKASVSREAMAAFLYRLNTPKGQTAPAGYVMPKTSPFADVAPGDKFYREIAWMHSAGISTGTKQAGKKPAYAPKGAVSREAMAAFLARMERTPGYTAPKQSRFADVTPRHKFYPQISWMYDTGLSTGTKQPAGLPRYEPSQQVTREAMAAFLYRLKN